MTVVSKVHTCIKQIKMIEEEERLEPPKGKRYKCRCRKMLAIEEVTKLYAEGRASWIILKRTPTEQEIVCCLCKGDLEFKKCANCGGSGKERILELVPTFGTDAVLISSRPIEEQIAPRATKKRTPRSSAIAMRTPRVPTIEKMHILRAYVSDSIRDFVSMAERGESVAGEWVAEETAGKIEMQFIRDRVTPEMAQAARDRIEEYGRLVLDARMYAGIDRVPMIGVEPADNPDTGEGRRFDYGRGL